jgi:hypothetical protein
LVLVFISAVFDNIPLTKLALTQNDYDWGVLAYAVGFGGSMVWFGSSAGVAISNMLPEAKSVGNWLKSGWHIIVAYIIGFAIMIIAIGGEWKPIHLDKSKSEHTSATDTSNSKSQPKPIPEKKEEPKKEESPNPTE